MGFQLKRDTFLHPTSFVEEGVVIGEGTKIWHLAQISKNANIGAQVTIGKNVYIGPGVYIGDYSKVQNNALVYESSVIGKGVFVGPGVIFTNDRFPRAVNVDQLPKKPDEWEKVGVTVNDYASIGAGAICVAPVSIGNWSMIGAGSVLTRDVPNYALFMGNPARFVCWVGRAGRPLIEVETKRFACSITNQLYELKDSNELELL